MLGQKSVFAAEARNDNFIGAGFIKDIDIKFLDLDDIPKLGQFDVMVSDLPFGIAIAKGEDLSKLYESFFACVNVNLKQDGIVFVYTIAQDLFEAIAKKYGRILEKTEMKIVSKQGVYLHPAVYVWKKVS